MASENQHFKETVSQLKERTQSHFTSGLLHTYIDKEGLTEEMVFNADETESYSKLLLQLVIQRELQKTLRQQKIVLLCLCAPMLLEHAKFLWHLYTNMLNLNVSSILTWNPCLSITILYENAWTQSLIFEKWFTKQFCPAVKNYLAAQQLPQKALLLVDNASPHCDCQFSSPDRNIVIISKHNQQKMVNQMGLQNLTLVILLCHKNQILH